MRRLPTLLALVSIACTTATPAAAQKRAGVPKRPKLQFTTDTNDAAAYRRLGEQTLDRDPRIAADAFYWATRLDPNSADAFYGLRTARHLAAPPRFKRYMEDDRKTIESPEVRQIDSLQARALMLNPFLYRKFDQLMVRSYIHYAVISASSGSDRPSAPDLDYHITLWMRQAGPETRAWMAYCDGRFVDALRGYADAVKGTKRKARLRTERGRIFFLMGNADSALAELRLALEELRKEDNKELVMIYDSKALLEHSIAKIHEALGDPDSARAAYGRALEEDLAFYPAHVNLGLLALQGGDTATALNELELAAQIRGDDPMIRLFYGYLLGRLGRFADAEAQLTKAIELEPYYARPYQLLGQVYQAQRKIAEAIAQYEAYLARAAVSDLPREEVAQELNALRAVSRGAQQ